MLKQRILKAIDSTRLNCAFVVKHLGTGAVAAFRENETVPSASLIKIAVAAEILSRAQRGELSLQQRIAVDDADKVPYSILTLLESGNSYSLHDLLTLMIVQSDNTAANLLIATAGMDRINRFCRDADLHGTILQRKMMDAAARKAGRENITTAADMARLLELLYRAELADPACGAHLLEIMKQQLDMSMMRLHLPDDTVVAHKTGELEGLAHEAGIVYHAAGDYIFVVLLWGAVTNYEARQTSGAVSKIVYDYFTEEEMK